MLWNTPRRLQQLRTCTALQEAIQHMESRLHSIDTDNNESLVVELDEDRL